MKTLPASEYALLGALMTGPRHGYQIRSFLREELGATWHIPTSQLYAQLRRLEEKRYVSSSLEPQESRPSRRVFELTPEGREAFLDWAQAPAKHVRDLRVEFLAKLFFLRRLSMDGTGLIQAQKRVLEHTLADMESRIKSEDNAFRRLTAEFKRATAGAWLQWLVEKAKPFVEEIKSG